MVSSANYSMAITPGHGSGGMSAIPFRPKVVKDDGEQKPVQIPDAKIKYRKIKQSDKYIVQGDWSEDYAVKIEVEATTKELEKNQELMNRYRLITFKLPTKRYVTYLKNCYKIDSIESPQRYQGAGTKAIKALLERSLADKDTEGRLVVCAEITDGQTSPAGFFYKLGFRFVDNNLNEIMEEWIKKKIRTDAPKLTGMMYLPKNNINKIMMSGKFLL